jgi:ATP-dependent Clp protease adaptor protein ClpS
MNEFPPDRPEPLPAPSSVSLPLYKVILRKGDADDMMLVIRTIMELTRFCVAEATQKMWEAHHNGQSLLLTAHRERAELFAEQFSDRGLSVTIEPV